MGVVSNIELKQLNQRRHGLIREFDRGNISFDKYTEEKKQLDAEIKNIIENLIVGEQEKIEVKLQKDKTEVQKMVEEEQAKKGAKKRAGSMAAFIEKALCMKSIKNKEQAADKVIELGVAKEKQFDRAKVISQIGAILRDVKKGESKRWAGYTWNAEDYLLTVPNKE